MENQRKQDIVELTAAEIMDFWNMYQYETMSLCGLKFFIHHVNDEQIRDVLESGISLAEKRKATAITYFNKSNHPIPQGFTDQDVNIQAPRLFSDRIYLHYLLNTTQLELINYGNAFVNAARSDVIDIFASALVESRDLHLQTKQLMKEKGIFLRIPSIPNPKQIDFVKKESFLNGWLGKQRPLIASEITHLVFNAKRNALGQAVIIAFSQVVQSKKLRRFFERGSEIAKKHLEIFSNTLDENHLGDAVHLLTSDITDSTEAPFSDKLMMIFITMLVSSGLGNYGLAISTSPRRDIGTEYTRLMAEIVKYAEDGMDLLIENGWLEQPPMATDRKRLGRQ